VKNDFFGNPIDPEVGYARGRILHNSVAEKVKHGNAVKKISQRITAYGEDSLYIFTGNHRWNQITPEDLGLMSEEWVGPALFDARLKQAALSHVKGKDDHAVAVFNRTSAGTIAAIMALTEPGETVVSLAPRKKPHPSVARGAKLAGANFYETETVEELAAVENDGRGLCVITRVTSELHLMEEDVFARAVSEAHKKGMQVFVDDAYGARICPIVLKQSHSLEIGADVIITNNDKAGMHGPRAGIMVGRANAVIKAAAKGSEYGMEGRAPIALGALRSLENFQSMDLLEEVQVGKEIHHGLCREMGTEKVRESLLGPEVSEENLLRFMVEKRPSGFRPAVVPCEASAAVGFVLLEKYGIVTINTCGMPGARVSLRLKANRSTVSRCGGTAKVIEAVMDAVMTVAALIDNEKSISKMVLGFINRNLEG